MLLVIDTYVTNQTQFNPYRRHKWVVRNCFTMSCCQVMGAEKYLNTHYTNKTAF